MEPLATKRFRMEKLEERIAPLIDVTLTVNLTPNDPTQIGDGTGPNVTIDPNNMPDPDGASGTTVHVQV